MDKELEIHFWYVVKEACLMKKALKTKGFLYIRDISIKKRVVKKLPIALERIMKAVGSIEIKGANF